MRDKQPRSARIGLLTPNDDAVPESELWTMAPAGVSVHVARGLLVNPRTYADPPHPDGATALLAALPMHAIVFGFTTTSYLLGPDGEHSPSNPSRRRQIRVM
jgi:maleate isomerase